jgi:hypothetical protein
LRVNVDVEIAQNPTEKPLDALSLRNLLLGTLEPFPTFSAVFLMETTTQQDYFLLILNCTIRWK